MVIALKTSHTTFSQNQLLHFFLPKIKVSAMEALKEPNLRLLLDLLSSDATTDNEFAVDVNKAYAEEKVNEPRLPDGKI